MVGCGDRHFGRGFIFLLGQSSLGRGAVGAKRIESWGRAQMERVSLREGENDSLQ